MKEERKEGSTIDMEGIFGEEKGERGKGKIPSILEKQIPHRRKPSPLLLLSRREKRSILGVDIGATSVKIVEITLSPEAPHLLNFGVEEIPQEEGDREEAVRKAIVGILDVQGIKTRRAAIVLSEAYLFVRTLRLPPMPVEETKSFLFRELKKYMPTVGEKLIVDFVLSGEILERGARKQEVSAVVAEEGTFRRILNVLEASGLEPVSINANPYALLSVFKSPRWRSNETLAIVDIGTSSTNVNIFRGEGLRYYRAAPIGIGHLHQAISSRLKIDLREAKEVVFKEEILKSSSTLFPIAESVIGRLNDEIRRTFNFYVEQTHGERVVRMILTGGGAALKGIDRFLSLGLGIPVTIGNPMEKLVVPEEVISKSVEPFSEISHRLSIAVGAALDFGKGINLLREEMAEKERLRKQRVIAGSISSLIVLLLLFTYSFVSFRVARLNRQLLTQKSQLEKVNAEVEKVKSLKEETKAIQKRVEFLSQSLRKPLPWVYLFKGISRIIPENNFLWLERLSGDFMGETNVAEIKLTGSAVGENLLSNFIEGLKKMPYFQEVRLLSTRSRGMGENEGKERVDFEILCEVKVS